MKSSIYKKLSAFNKSSKPLPKYNLGGPGGGGGYSGSNYEVDMGQASGGGGGTTGGMGNFSGGNMIGTGIGAVSSMIPEGQVYNPQGSIATDQEGLDKQNTRTDRLNKSSKGLASAASTAAMIPGVGWIAGGILGLASLGTKIGAKASAKKAGGMETVTYMQDGGKVNTLEGDLYSKVIMERNRDKEFVQRAFNSDPNKVQYNLDGTTSTHKMGWGTDDTGQAYMFPTIFNPNNEAVKVPNQYADYISTEGYKKATGMIKKNGGYSITNLPNNMASWQYPEGGKVKPIITTNLNDPRLKAYNDSLRVFNAGEKEFNYMQTNPSYKDWAKYIDENEILNNYMVGTMVRGKYSDHDRTDITPGTYRYKKPTQPVVYKSEEKTIYDKDAKEYQKTANFTDKNGNIIKSDDMYSVSFSLRKKEEPIQFPDKSKPQMEIVRPKEVGKAKHNFKWQSDPNFPGTEMSMDEPGVYKDKKGVFTGKKNDYKLDVIERFDDGGSLIKYNLPSHESGGGTIDSNGRLVNPNSQLASAELEKKETLDPNQNYVFSDTLKPMDNKRTFASISKSIDGKYKDKIDPIAKASKDRELARLAQSNETMRLTKEAKNNPLKKNGGSLPKYENGSPFVEDYNRDGLTYLNSIGYGNTLFLEDNPFNSPELGNIKRVNSAPGLSIGSPFALPQEQAYDGTNYPIPSTTYNANKQSNPLTTSNKVNPTTGDYLQFGAGALSGITNLAMGLKKPDKFSPLTSQYFNSGLKDMDQKARFNPNEILMNRNVGMNQINQGSSSNATRMANLQGLFRGTNTQLGQLAEKENLANIGIKQNLGQAKIGVGAQDLMAQERARGLNIQSKATAQNLRKTGLEQIYGSIGSLGQLQNQSKLNTQQLNVLNSLAKNYGVSPETMMIMFKNGLVQLPK